MSETTDGAFRRARSPDQKAERRAQILAAATALLEESLDSSDLSLNELARAAGMAKSNVYRYFESREAILLALLAEATERWCDEVVEALAGIGGEDPVQARLDAVAGCLAAQSARRPLMCHLMSVLPSVLEHNLSAASVRRYKLESLAVLERLSAAMHGVVPELSVAQHGELLHQAFSLIVGGWPLAHPSEVAAEVLSDPRLAGFRHDFEADLARGVSLMARGLLAR